MTVIYSLSSKHDVLLDLLAYGIYMEETVEDPDHWTESHPPMLEEAFMGVYDIMVRISGAFSYEALVGADLQMWLQQQEKEFPKMKLLWQHRVRMMHQFAEYLHEENIIKWSQLDSIRRGPFLD